MKNSYIIMKKHQARASFWRDPVLLEVLHAEMRVHSRLHTTLVHGTVNNFYRTQYVLLPVLRNC